MGQLEKVSPHSLQGISNSSPNKIGFCLLSFTSKWRQSMPHGLRILILNSLYDTEPDLGSCLRGRCIDLGTRSNQLVRVLSSPEPLFWDSKKGLVWAPPENRRARQGSQCSLVGMREIAAPRQQRPWPSCRAGDEQH